MDQWVSLRATFLVAVASSVTFLVIACERGQDAPVAMIESVSAGQQQ